MLYASTQPEGELLYKATDTVHEPRNTYMYDPRGGHSTFFQVGVCGPDFRSVGLAN